MSKKLVYILLVGALILIIIGLITQIYKCNQIITEKDQLIDSQAQELIKLRIENEALWDNYYMNASNYEGYEYYE
jgi:cell division protein FtsL